MSVPSSPSRPDFQLGAIILCGGQSTRMGLPKATLPFGAMTMLERVTTALQEVCQPLIVVAADGQPLPNLPAVNSVQVVCDRRPQRGPLEGLITGLTALLETERPRPITHVYATSCDVPMLCPQWPLALLEKIGGAQVAVPFDESFHHPLAAIYRTDVLAPLEQLSDRDELRPRRLFDLVDTVRVPVEQLRQVDPDLATLNNINTPEDYFAALAQHGLNCPAEIQSALQRPLEH